MIVTDERVARFVGERVHSIVYPPFTCMGIERDGEIIAGVVFNSFIGTSISATVAGNGFNRSFLASVGDYVFRQLGCCRITIITEQDKVANIAARLGAVKEGILRDHFGEGRDGVLMGILKKDYQFSRRF